MKKLFVLIGSMAFFFSCSNNADTGGGTADSADHRAHNHSGSSAPGQSDLKAMHAAMNNMMDQMQRMKPTGDPDYDFAMMMKYHHQGAIDMAKAELAGGSDEALKQMAQKMIDEQQKENARFDQFMQGKEPAGNADFGQRLMDMMTPMSAIRMESSSPDTLFASMMIPHHQDAVKMAAEYGKAGKDEALKQIATNILQTQPKEIGALQSWLQKR